jgi:hypothetical protein
MSCSFDKLIGKKMKKYKTVTANYKFVLFLLHKFLEDFLIQLNVKIKVLFSDYQRVDTRKCKFL